MTVAKHSFDARQIERVDLTVNPLCVQLCKDGNVFEAHCGNALGTPARSMTDADISKEEYLEIYGILIVIQVSR